jgi:hypothetical protein
MRQHRYNRADQEIHMPRLQVSICLVAGLAISVAPWARAADEPEAAETSTAPAQVAAERPPTQSRGDAMAADLVRQLSASEFVSLKEGDKDFVALWRPANVGSPKGVIILLPGEGESADWPRGIGPLRRGLPDHGWHTLSLSLPDSPALVVQPPATAAEEQAPAEPADETDTEAEQTDADKAPDEAGYLPEETAATPDEPPPAPNDAQPTDEQELAQPDQPERIAERIEAALAFARSKQPKVIVFLGQGAGSYWAAHFIQQQGPADVRQLVMVRPQQPDGQDEPLAQLVPTLKLATGDFYYRDSVGSESAARERLNASRRLDHPAYRQVKLPPQTGDRQVDQEQLVRRVRGWLDKQR